MPEQNVSDQFSLTDWQAEILRLTAFPSPAAEIDEPKWWADLVGELPETSVSHPRKGVWQEEGPFEDGELVLKVQLNRIDWLFTSANEPEQEIENFATIGPFSKSLDAFLSLILRWFELKTCPSVQRLAFGAVLLQPVEDQRMGYRKIAAHLPTVELDPDGSSDFLYQINRPRNSRSGIATLRINRLSKWSVTIRRDFGLSIEPASAGYFLGREYFACRVELDINTTPDFRGELAGEQLSRVFQELVDLGKEIVSKGDIP